MRLNCGEEHPAKKTAAKAATAKHGCLPPLMRRAEYGDFSRGKDSRDKNLVTTLLTTRFPWTVFPFRAPHCGFHLSGSAACRSATPSTRPELSHCSIVSWN